MFIFLGFGAMAEASSIVEEIQKLLEEVNAIT